MTDIPSKPPRNSVTLSDTILASAQNVQAVLAGASLTDSLAATPAPLRAASQAIAFHVMRRLGLVREIKQLLVQRTPPNALFDAVLLVSLALLDAAVEFADDASPDHVARRDVPVYAVHTVVDQAVNAVAGQRKLQSYKGLLNATLRGFIRERNAILAQARQNPVAVFNHPKWWITQVRRAYPAQWQELLSAANRPGPMTLRVNARRSSVEKMLAELDAAGIQAMSPAPGAIVLSTPRPVQSVPGFEQGWWSVQDLAAQQAAQLLPVEPGMRVLDACAAPGGKMAHLLELADIELLALDSDAMRLERVEQNLHRLGLGGANVTMRCADAMDVNAWWDGRHFDAVLADVPCTASGVVRRHPDIRWLRRDTDIAKTAALQAGIVDALWQTVKPGGHLLYATCSIFPQEGEQQAAQFMARHADAVRKPAPGQLLPLASDPLLSSDGFFYALFAKKA
ncbi:methyltransferase [Pollutimonas subterranea]|uniref:16S rRNA (cytosine(967)-C(5))-methyltransferase n=1 Tax=Pollutimonas subterranea TaxID=2045210 RepID=A0A2N4U1K5_9BURK|nr:16S rRNA (cytosine(967)-C(5))-methyltransferase RsmB [Pollutimonas subterranea]PLC48890.1 methyltransferase [Pollutimonas subterranea]